MHCTCKPEIQVTGAALLAHLCNPTTKLVSLHCTPSAGLQQAEQTRELGRHGNQFSR